MVNGKLYFAAILPPKYIRNEIQEIRYNIREKYNSSHALNAPPHITLLSPFRSNSSEEKIKGLLEDLISGIEPFQLGLSDFDCFSPRVLFIDVVKNDSLNALQSTMESGVREYSDIFNYGYDNRPFHPHLTLAFKDLNKSDFYRAWKVFSKRTYSASFDVKEITLLHHHQKKWIPTSFIPLTQ